jgi:hypothetical protein
VVTTHAAVADQAMTMPIHHQLAARELLPAEHLMDAGYPATANLLACQPATKVSALVTALTVKWHPTGLTGTYFRR